MNLPDDVQYAAISVRSRIEQLISEGVSIDDAAEKTFTEFEREQTKKKYPDMPDEIIQFIGCLRRAAREEAENLGFPHQAILFAAIAGGAALELYSKRYLH